MEKPVKSDQVTKQKMAVELCALYPDITNKELSKKLGIDYKKACAWRNDPKFIEAYVDRFIEMVGKEVPLVMKALIREAKEGNTRAAEIFLKQVGRLQETLTVKIEAPFMQHLKNKQGSINTDDAITLGEEIDHILVEEDYTELPPRDPKNDHQIRERNNDFKKTREVVKAAKKNVDRNQRYSLRKRAERVGLDPLPAGRPHPAKRKAWLKKLEGLERGLK